MFAGAYTAKEGFSGPSEKGESNRKEAKDMERRENSLGGLVV